MGVVSTERLWISGDTQTVTSDEVKSVEDGSEDWTYLSCLSFRQLQDGQMALQVHAGEKTAPLFLKTGQVLK